jgi:hypothetical protein
VVVNVLWCICAYFQTTRIKYFKTIFFNVWSGKKRALMHLHILPNHQNPVLKKIFFNVLSGYIRVFTHLHFNVYCRVVKNVFWCIFAYFQTTRNICSKMMLLNVWSGNIRVLMHLRILPDHQKHGLKNDVI